VSAQERQGVANLQGVTRCGLIAVTLAQSIACASSAPPARAACVALEAEVNALIVQHDACTLSDDCVALGPRACLPGLECGAVIAKDQKEAFATKTAPLIARYHDCQACDADRRCKRAKPMCKDGHCKVYPQELCGQLAGEAQALIEKHNACTADSDCVYARGGSCPGPLACAVLVNAKTAEAFSAATKSLSERFHEACGTCSSTECRGQDTGVCHEGRCVSQYNLREGERFWSTPGSPFP
jgi:hypothetical protein